MINLSDTELFNQLHIDVARNATDDFNLFHDSKNGNTLKKRHYRSWFSTGILVA